MISSSAYPFDPSFGYNLDSLLQIEPPMGPCDLADFWKKTYRDARKIPLNITSRQVACDRTDVDLFEVEYDSWGERRIGAWMTIPRDVPVERGMVVGHGYGGRPSPEFGAPGLPCARIFPCARGFDRSRSSDIPDNSINHVLVGIQSPETYIHRGCVVDFWGAASVLIDLYPGVANSLHYMGASFGGGIGAMVLAWDDRFSSGFLGVPSFGNHPVRVSVPCMGSGESVRNYYAQHPEVLDVLQYFDSASIAGYIQIPVLVECALFDPCVPPPGQFSVYNAIRSPKTLAVRQAGHHAFSGEEEENRRSEGLRDQWFKSKMVMRGDEMAQDLEPR